MLSFINITVATPVSMAKRVLIFLLCVFAFWTASRAHASESISIEGFWKGEKRTLGGKLYLPDNNKGPVPVVVMIHGTAGPGYRYYFHREGLLEAGIATFEVDFKSGIFSDSRDRPYPQPLIPFAYGALKALRKNAAVDPKRIGLMGFSFGGGITVAAMEHVQKLKALGGSEKGFLGHVAYYPSCRFRKILPSTCAPLLILAGGEDSYGDGKFCGAFIESFNQINPGLGSLKIYPGVEHGFDGNKSWSGYDRAAIDQRAILQPNYAAATDARKRDVMLFKKVFGMAGPYEFNRTAKSCSYKAPNATANLDPQEAAKKLIKELGGFATMDSMMKAEEALELGDKKGNKFWLEVNKIATKIIDGQ
jgi:dienelactone hydrolase